MNGITIFLKALLLTSLSTVAFASVDQAPPSFPHKEGKAIFVDFQKSSHEITYDYANKKVTVASEIVFTAAEEGYPIFDLVPEPIEITLDGETSSADLTADPDGATFFRILHTPVTKGTYTLKIKHEITTNVVFDEKGVASAFWLSDLTDRKYLEQYLPSNLEFDQHPRTFRVSLLGVEEIQHTIKANGVVSRIDDQTLEVQYPDFYSNSSVFFHLFPTKSIERNVQFYYPSIDGRLLPVDIYAIVDIEPFVELTKTLLAELENDYGPFPHDNLIIYGTSLVKGGMEYSGATMTGLLSLGHELFHSYNARGVMPANGNAGWMDEAMARWRDNKYPLASELTFDSTRVAGHSVWRRFTDRMAYTEGSAFLSLIAHRMSEKGQDLKSFLGYYLRKHMYSTVTTQLFEQELADATQMDFSFEFNRYIYGMYAPFVEFKKVSPQAFGENPHHPSYTKDELLRLTMPLRI